MREADVGREPGRELGKESALVTLDSGAKIPDNQSKKRRVAIRKNEIGAINIKLTRAKSQENEEEQAEIRGIKPLPR